MSIVSISEAAELKKVIKTKFGADIHFHDACGGQYFSVDNANEDLKSFVLKYFAEKGLSARFSEDLRGFYVV